MKFSKSLWRVFCFSFQNISQDSGANTDNFRLLISSSKVRFIVIYVEPLRTLNAAFYCSFPNTVKPGK